MDTYIQTITMSTVNCAQCHITFGTSRDFNSKRQEDHATFYCPQGHHNYYPQESDEEKLRWQLRSSEARRIHAEDEAAAAERSRRALKGQLTRIRNRVATGVCPWCKRNFGNVQRHVQSQHPEHIHELKEAQNG